MFLSVRLPAFVTGVFIMAALEPQSSAAAEMDLNEVVKKTQISGFLSIRGGQIREEDVTYLITLDDSWSFSDESLIGLQMDTQVSDKLSTSIQFTSKTRGESVNLEWAFLEYAFQPDLKVRAGRLRAPGFMLSEFLDVGYAYPWAQVPDEVYGWLPSSRYEGLDLRYWTSYGAADLRVNPFLGTTTNQKISLGNVDYADQESRFYGIEVQMNYDIYSARIGFSKYKFELSESTWDRFISSAVDGVTVVPDMGPFGEGVEVPGFVDYVEDIMVNGVLAELIAWPELADFVPVFQAEQTSLLNQLPPYQSIPLMNGRFGAKFYGIGFSADDGTYLLMTEACHSAIGGLYPDVESGYIMAGYRFGNLMPHVTVSRMYTVDDDERPHLSPLDVNELIWNSDPQLQQVVAGAAAYTDLLIASAQLLQLDATTYTVSVRWDPVASLALKAEIFRADLKNGSYGFVLPESIVALATQSSTSTSLESISIPEAPDSVDGMRVSIDVVF